MILLPIDKANRSGTQQEAAWIIKINFWAFIAALWMPVTWLHEKAAQKHNREVAALKYWRIRHELKP